MSVKLTELETVRQAIARYELSHAREPRSVKLIAVSKTRTAADISRLYEAGQTAFGENYLQEALVKIEYLQARNIEWHFIGAIQSKKAALIAQHFDWVHSLDRLKVAQKLNQFRDQKTPLQVLIQVNLEEETSKGGVPLDQLEKLAGEVETLGNLNLRGLMFMPKMHQTFADQQAVFGRAQSSYISLQRRFPNMDQLSMGMSGDMQAAISKGATMVRIGTALFGARQ